MGQALAVTNKWRDVIEKGNDNYYLEATSNKSSRPAGGAIIGGNNGEAFGTPALAVNTWTHLAATYDGSALRLYVNGNLTGTTAKTGAITASTAALTIGSDPFYGQYFAGLIDEIRIYNIALTQAQIQTDMAAALGGPDAQAPSAPGTLSATAVSGSRVDLAWGAATDNLAVTGYRIERCQGAGCTNFAQIAAPPGTGDQLQRHHRRQRDELQLPRSSRRCGPATSAPTATPHPPRRPRPTRRRPQRRARSLRPRSRAAGSTSPGSQPPTTSPSRATRSSAARVPAARTSPRSRRPAGTATVYSDTGVAASTTYRYRVRATDAAANLGAYGNIAAASTPAAPDTQAPSAPGTLTATAVSSGRIDLAWGAATDDVAVTGYLDRTLPGHRLH